MNTTSASYVLTEQ